MDVGSPVDEHCAPWKWSRKILVATDGSPAADEAIILGVQLASEHHSEVIFVHVVPTLDLGRPVDTQDAAPGILHEPGAYDRAILDDAAAFAAEQGVVASSVLLGGASARAIAAYGESQDVDLIIVGCRGHRAVTGALLGSVSLGLLRESARRVLIVRGAKAPGERSGPRSATAVHE